MNMIFRYANTGDKVWDWFSKSGIIIEIDEFDVYPIKVQFDNNEYREYTYSGDNTLFWKEIIIPDEALRKDNTGL